MNWTCLTCQRSNPFALGPDEAGTIRRFCAWCGVRAIVDPERGVASFDRDAETRSGLPRRPGGERPEPRPILVLLAGRRVGAELPLPGGRVRIGGDGADWDFPELGLAPVHFQIQQSLGRCLVRDLTSGTPGILVNASQAEMAELHNGDQIRAGGATFLFLAIVRTEAAVAGALDAPTGVHPRGEELAGVFDGPAPAEAPPGPFTVVVPKPRPATGSPMSVEIVEGPDAPRTVPLLFASNVIGRGAGEVSLTDPLVSSRHAEIGRLPGGGLFVKDLASSNGTRLNGSPVEYSPVEVGDRLSVGDTVLRVVAG